MKNKEAIDFCEVKFLNKLDTKFYSRETIFGNLEINPRKSFEICKLYLKICGSASLQNRADIWQKRDKNFSEIQTFLDAEKILIDGYQMIRPGKQFWDFKYFLYPTLPSSTNEKYGEITYKILVIFECLYGAADLEYTVDFEVVQNYTSFSSPVRMEEALVKKVLGFQIMTAKFSIPTKFYKRGHQVTITCEIENKFTRITADNLDVSLFKEITFKFKEPHDKTRKIYERTQLLPDHEHFNNNNTLVVTLPEVLVPSISEKQCDVLNISYFLAVKTKFMKMGNFGRNSVVFPIVIGGEIPASSSCALPKPIKKDIGFVEQTPVPTFPPLHPLFPILLSQPTKISPVRLGESIRHENGQTDSLSPVRNIGFCETNAEFLTPTNHHLVTTSRTSLYPILNIE